MGSLDIWEYFSYKKCMAKRKGPGRPKKPTGQVRNADLRIPVTVDEKARIQAAAEMSDTDSGMAAWARRVLLKAADSAADASAR